MAPLPSFSEDDPAILSLDLGNEPRQHTVSWANSSLSPVRAGASEALYDHRSKLHKAGDEVSDEVLVQEVLAHHLPGYEQLYDRYAGLAFGLARRIVRSPEVAEEVIQEVFFKLWLHPESFDVTRASFRTWFLSAVHHRAIDEVRRRQVCPHASLEEHESEVLSISGGVDPEVAAFTMFRSLRIRQAIAALSIKERRVVELSYFGGLTLREIAEHLAKPLGTVKSCMRRALAQLRRSLPIWQDV